MIIIANQSLATINLGKQLGVFLMQRIELTEAGVPPYILRGQTEYTSLSFYRLIKRPTDTQAKRGASTAVQTISYIQNDVVAARAYYVYHRHKYVQLHVRDQTQVWMTARSWLSRKRPAVVADCDGWIGLSPV